MVFVGFGVVYTNCDIIRGTDPGDGRGFDVKGVTEFSEAGFKFFAFVDANDGF